MDKSTAAKGGSERASKPSPNRLTLAIIIGLAVATYILAVVLGGIPKEQQLSVVDLIVIVLAAVGITLLLRPDAFDRLKRVGAGAFSLELSDVKRKLDDQRNELEVIYRILPLLLPDTERKHLHRLYDGKTSKYEGRQSLRSELRRLRSAGLIRMREGRNIGHIKNDLKVDLADYIQLTELGDYWAKQIKEMEQLEPVEEPESSDET